MKAVVKAKPGRGLELREVPVPEFGHGDLLVKVQKVGVCGTDLHIYLWDAWAQKTIKPPMVIGHEFVGEIVAMGSEVNGYQVGERISGEGHIVCGVCRSCRAGRRHLCTRTIGLGVNRDGCFAEYLSLPASNAWHLDAKIPSEIAAIFDPYGNAAHCALSFNMVGEDVLITGAGPIGLIAVAISRFVGARNVVITDVNDYRLALARKLGATAAVNSKNETLRETMQRLGMIGFDIGLEMSGNGDAFEAMLESMYHGGRIALLGILPAATRIDWDQVIFKGLTLKGIYGREMYETWYKMQTMLQSGLNIAPVLTHRFPFAEFEKGFAAMESRQCGKVVLELDAET
ncbi:MAG: L-threonine 3-dehydrogenase [Lentisphaerae bacterium RIFOXYB12_FULL_65_16]|nr:MAG: L-threonine 3-dehydrogenase [Lentisphaerae bacterium RIFOXYA12_64_32]OGV90726.1 MAG: L-threonine 3-dehydrogenase [Lentisphaerae bacterium RIFOXYB12_FULL_65_16]